MQKNVVCSIWGGSGWNDHTTVGVPAPSPKPSSKPTTTNRGGKGSKGK